MTMEDLKERTAEIEQQRVVNYDFKMADPLVRVAAANSVPK